MGVPAHGFRRHSPIPSRISQPSIQSPMKKILPFLLVIGVALAGCGRATDTSAGGAKKLTIALLPKSKGNAYFVSCRAGAERAAKDLGVTLIFDGPTDTDPAKQN